MRKTDETGAPGPVAESHAAAGPPGRVFGLAAKLGVCLVVSTAALFGLFGYLNLNLERRHFESMVLLSAERVSDIIHGSARHQMLRNDREGLYAQIRDLGAEAGVSRVRIFNKEGLISFSTDPREVGSMVDKRAEACYACHSQQAPLAKLSRPDRARSFKDPHGQRVLAVIRPIENRPECSNAACHAHPPGRRILGVIDAHLSLQSVDEQIAGHQRQFVGFTVAAILVMSLLSVVFVWVVVHRPIQELTLGTQKVATGDLSHRLEVRSRDELGLLAASFNKMTADLAEAHSELTDWARTLEDRVRRKTQQLERAHTSLVASEKMASLGKLAATVAHEVNNPLFGMLTCARLTLKKLRGAELEPAAKAAMVENVQIIERESRRCGDLMRNLLTFARQSPPHPAPNDLNVLVDRALSLIRHQAELQEIEIEHTPNTGLPPVSCDAGQIQQVLLALLVNACEAMPHGGVLRVATEAETDGRAVRVRVRDTGMGIAPEILPQIFEPFFTTKEIQQRTGLGLAIARSIVERHGGSLAVDSAPGGGAEFVVTLPLEQLAAFPAAAGPRKNEDRK